MTVTINQLEFDPETGDTTYFLTQYQDGDVRLGRSDTDDEFDIPKDVLKAMGRHLEWLESKVTPLADEVPF